MNGWVDDNDNNLLNELRVPTNFILFIHMIYNLHVNFTN